MEYADDRSVITVPTDCSAALDICEAQTGRREGRQRQAARWRASARAIGGRVLIRRANARACGSALRRQARRKHRLADIGQIGIL